MHVIRIQTQWLISLLSPSFRPFKVVNMSRESPLESLPILQLTATTVVALLTGFFIGQKFSNRKVKEQHEGTPFNTYIVLKDADAMPTKKAQAEEADSDSDLDEAPVGKVDVGKYGDNFKMVGGILGCFGTRVSLPCICEL